MTFGDAVTVRTHTGEMLAVYLWRPEGCEPSIFLNGRAVRLGLDAILTPWRCSACGGSRIVWAVRIQPRCGTCVPLSTREKEFIAAYATGAVRHLASKLDSQNGKNAMYAQLDQAIASGDFRELVRLSLEMLAGSFILKHELGDLL